MADRRADPGHSAVITAPIIETERLRLRPHRVEDFEALAAFFTTERSHFVGGPLDRRGAWLSFASDVGQWVLLGFGAWAIDHRETGIYMGQIALNHPAHFPEREIGWLLWDGLEGCGYAYEAALAVRNFAYGTLGWQTLVSYIDPENDRSISLAKRLGASLEAGAPTPNNDPCLVFRHPSPG